MLTKESKKILEKQHYGVVGEHSAVKVCGWTKKMIRGEGGCYKFKFYGIRSHQCMQMTTSISCANRCIYCWRDYKAPVSKDWIWDVDDPDFIIDTSIHNHQKLLTGFGGNEKANKTLLEQSKTVGHVALSLTGEPITYPKINEILDKFHERRISTFLVTNAQYPEKIKNLRSVTQLYISLDAPDKKTAKEIGKPLFPDYWQRLEKCLIEMSKKEFRTTIRMTMIKGMNMDDLKGYKRLIELSKPDFIEIKAYMFVGASRQRLTIDNMPRHHEIKEFSENFVDILEDYHIINEHEPSRVVLLAKKHITKSWIDFDTFFTLTKTKVPKTEEYMQ